MHFNLSLGKAFGGTVVAKPIMLWLDPFLRTTLADLIVWPNRIVVPLSYDPDFDYSVLEMRCGLREPREGCTPLSSMPESLQRHQRAPLLLFIS